MRRTVLGLVIGFTLGLATFWAGVMVTGGWHEYRILTGSMDNFERWIERDRCEPFMVRDIMIGRCPRFRW